MKHADDQMIHTHKLVSGADDLSSMLVKHNDFDCNVHRYYMMMHEKRVLSVERQSLWFTSHTHTQKVRKTFKGWKVLYYGL